MAGIPALALLREPAALTVAGAAGAAAYALMPIAARAGRNGASMQALLAGALGALCAPWLIHETDRSIAQLLPLLAAVEALILDLALVSGRDERPQSRAEAVAVACVFLGTLAIAHAFQTLLVRGWGPLRLVWLLYPGGLMLAGAVFLGILRPSRRGGAP